MGAIITGAERERASPFLLSTGELFESIIVQPGPIALGRQVYWLEPSRRYSILLTLKNESMHLHSGRPDS
jgi:hypothetical protein